MKSRKIIDDLENIALTNNLWKNTFWIANQVGLFCTNYIDNKTET